MGNEMYKVLLVAGDGTGKDTFWNGTIMKDLADALPGGLLEKFRYAKFTGLASEYEYDSKKTGKKEIGHDILIRGVEMQNGEFITSPKKEKKSDNEDAF